MARAHYHVHSSLGNGYLCECDNHYPYDAAGRDAALRDEARYWRDYAAEVNADPTLRGISHIVVRGSVRAGWFAIDDTLSRSWARYVDSWACTEFVGTRP